MKFKWYHSIFFFVIIFLRGFMLDKGEEISTNLISSLVLTFIIAVFSRIKQHHEKK